jgi:HPt (histidine-containing phosphotransfer) domain-containing protein
MKFSADTAARMPAVPVFDRADTPPLVPADPIIDTDHLARMTLGEADLEREVLHLFECQAGILLGRMANEPPKAVAALAHTLTGSARGIGAWKVAAAAEAVERAANSQAPVALAGVMERLVAAVSEAQATIAAMARLRKVE